jgi:peptide/nickel transport system substrate-binding protein
MLIHKIPVRLLGLFVAASLVLCACGPTPEPQVIEKEVTRVVQETVVEKETVVETVVQKETVVVTAEPKAGEQEEPEASEDRTLVVGLSFEDGDSIDGAVYWEADNIVIPLNVQEPLVRYKVTDAGVELEPWLAESWEVSPDFTEYTLKLREGVTFHDGTMMDAEAIKFNWDRMIEIGRGSSYLYLDTVEECEVIDDYMVRFKLNGSLPHWLHTLAGVWSFRPQSPAWLKEHEVDGDMGQQWATDHECGTGPYVLEEWTHDDRAVLAKYDDYWQGWEGSHVEKAIIKFVPEGSTQRLMLESGELDIVFSRSMTPEDLKALMSNPEVEVESFPGTRDRWIALRLTRPPLDNVKVRQALAYAMNYDAVIEGIYGGFAERTGPLRMGFVGDDESLHTQYQYNPDKAESLLEEAGVEDLSLTCLYMNEWPEYTKIAELLQSDLAKIGVQVKLDGQPMSTWASARKDPDYPADIFIGGFSVENADHFSAITPLYAGWSIPPAGYNLAWYQNSEVDALFDKAKVEADFGELAQIYREIGQILLDESPYIWAAQLVDVIPHTKALEGFRYDAVANLMHARIYELYK